MTSIITQLFGAYTPLINSQGEVLQGLAGVNWGWIAGAALGIVCIVFCLKVGIMVLKAVLR